MLVGSRVSLSLRGVTIYSNSYLSLGDILGGFIDDEALQCHTDNINCCDSGLAENASVSAEWHYPNGSKVSSVDDNSSNNESNFNSSDGFFTRKSQSLIGLFAGRGSTEMGRYCCKIQDQNGLNQTMCVNLGKN